MLVTNNVVDDPRVRREATALAEAGHDVTVIGAGRENTASARLDGVRVGLVPYPETLRAPNPRELIDQVRDRSLAELKRGAPDLFGILARVYRTVRHGGRSPDPPVAPAPAPAAPSPSAPSGVAYEPYWVRATRELNENLLSLYRLNLAMADAAALEQADVYHAHDLDTLLAGHLARRRTGGLLVYDFHE